MRKNTYFSFEMYENLIYSDIIFYYLLPALFGGIVFVYILKKLLSNSSDNQNLKTSEESSETIEPKSEDLNLTNNNHYPNGKTIKVNDSDNTNNFINNNKFEVTEDIIKSESSAQPLERELSISSDNSDNNSDNNLNDETPEENEVKVEELIEEVNEVITKTESKPTNHLLKSEIEVQKVNDLAAIILTDDNRSDWYEIVCITSGSDVIDRRYLKPEFVVVDSRAPVLARRCLIRYLYQKLNELVKFEVKEEDSLFTAIPASNRFELKKNFKLNLYLSEPPDNCGTDSLTNGLTKRNSSQLIRLKSTTDKISLWNQVGVQGSLLTHFIDTIYLNSVIIPVEFNQKSFHKHFLQNYTKEPKLSKLEYNLITEIIEQINRVRMNGRRSCMSLATNWIKTEDSMEIIDCKIGKAINDVTIECTEDRHSISRLSKHELNKCFRDFLTNYEYNLRPHQSLPMTYRKWKESAPNYRIQKQLLKVRYAVAGRQWICLPSDLDLFI